MIVVTINEANIDIISSYFSESILSFDSLDVLATSICENSQKQDCVYRVSNYIAFGFGYIDGKRKCFLFGSDSGMREVFGSRCFVEVEGGDRPS